MKTHELLEDSDTDLYVKAIERMFANLGLPDALKIPHKVMKTKVVLYPDSDKHKIRYSNMKEDVEAMIARIASEPWEAVRFALAIGKPWPAGEKLIATDPFAARNYAFDVIKGPWPPGEAVISKDAESSINYAKYAIKGPWPPGEAVIAKRAGDSYRYAVEVIGGRWPPGEKKIMADLIVSGWYRQKFKIKGPWPEAGIK